MADLVKVELGAVQETLFIPLAARARETRRRRPLLRDPKAAEILASVDFDTKKYGRGWGDGVTVLRTAIFDCWVSDFLAEHPGGTVVEIGTGLNSRFDRADNGRGLPSPGRPRTAPPAAAPVPVRVASGQPDRW